MHTWAPNIIVELTERSYATNGSNYLLDAVKKIKKMGYRIFVDDIGTGRNILSHVQDNVNLVDGIKFAWQHFKEDSCQISISFLKEWDNLAKKIIWPLFSKVLKMLILKYYYKKWVSFISKVGFLVNLERI